MHLPYWPDNRPYTDSRKYFYIYVPADPPPAPDCRRTDRDNSSSSVFFRCPDPGTVSRPPLLCSYRYCTLQWLLHNPHNRLSSRNNNTACILSAKRYPVPVFSGISIMNTLSRPVDHFPISHWDFSIPFLCINMFSHYRISQRRRNLRIHSGAVIPGIPHIIPVSCAGCKCTSIRTERNIRTVVNGLFRCRFRLYRKQERNSQHE